MTGTLAVSRWLVARLKADATLTELVGDRIYRGVAPQGAEGPAYDEPFVLYGFVGGSDEDALCERASSRYLFDVQVVIGGEAPDALEPIATRIDALLQGAEISLTDDDDLTGYVSREGTIDRTEQDGSNSYQYIGGTYAASISA